MLYQFDFSFLWDPDDAYRADFLGRKLVHKFVIRTNGYAVGARKGDEALLQAVNVSPSGGPGDGPSGPRGWARLTTVARERPVKQGRITAESRDGEPFARTSIGNAIC